MVVRMNAYTDFAGVYDTFMDETPYEQWHKVLLDFLKQYKITEGLVLDLGCGTGTMTELMSRSGYDMIGIDYSGEMLQIASEKKRENQLDILYLEQNMCGFELYGTVQAIYSICDSVNYILQEEELIEVFRLANNYLEPNGIFVFDFNTSYKYREVIGETTIAENREDCSFIWENFYDEESDINEYDLTVFKKEENGLYEKFSETHYQKGYTVEQMVELVVQGGMHVECVCDADTMEEPCNKSERIYIVAREQGKLK